MSGYTSLSCLLWEWAPWVSMDYASRNLWLGLYTSPQSKRLIPGLFQGHIHTMAEAARMPFEDAIVSLDNLLNLELVEYDRTARVLRLCSLPDAGEWPMNASIMSAWWGRFQMIPPCAVRDAHVATLRWLLDRGAASSSRNKTKRPSQNHEDVWRETFATVQIPSPRRRGVRRLAESDTSTSVQPGLFAPSTGSLEPSLTVTTPCPPNPELTSSTASGSDLRSPNHKKLCIPETVSTLSGEGDGVGVGFFSSSLSAEGDLGRPPSSGAISSVEGDLGGGHGSGSPRLTLIHGGFDADDLAEMLVLGTSGIFPRALTKDERTQLQRAIGAAGDLARGDGVLALLREYLASRTSCAGISPESVADPGWLPSAIQQALTWKAEVDAKRAMLAAARTEVGF